MEYDGTKRHKTAYPGVIFRLVRRVGGKKDETEKVYYAIWKEDGKKIEARCGSEFRDAMTAARASRMRGEFIKAKGKQPSRNARKMQQTGH